MKTLQIVKNLLLSASVLFIAVSCNDDDGPEPFVPGSEVYQLAEVGASGVSGTATFTEQEDGSTIVEIELTGTTAGNMHPAHIHQGSIAVPGNAVITLNDVDGDTGRSVTQVIQMDVALTPLTYDELVEYGGYINVHLSNADDSVVAQGNIGSSE